MIKKIIFVGNTSWSMIKFRKGLLKKLVKLGFEVTVVSPFDDYCEEIISLGCKYQKIMIDNKGSNPLKDIRLIIDLKKIYEQIKPDLIIHYTIKPNIYGTIAAKLSHIKSFAVVTGLGFTFINDTFVSKIAKLLYKFSFQFSDKVFFINKDDRKEFIDGKLITANKTFLIPSEGISIELFYPESTVKNTEEFRFLLIARMLWDKGVGEYVEAAKVLKRKDLKVEFGLLGYLDVANPKAISKEQMNSWVNDGFVKFYGSTDNVKSFISKSDCIVLPSYREGISMTLMESASMEKPLIATNVPGCKDVVDDGINGFLCEVKNAQDLADKMEMMLKLTSEERRAMGKAGREKMIREFDEKIVIDKYLEAIESVLKK
ncbi:MAG: glycosyltransferase family 4 protein [Epsilonproteobacteria bacterium]|nr:glycosyltransferase family 4 protein [Campylobacterota bacterium]